VVGGRYWDVAEDDYIFLNDVQVEHATSPRMRSKHTEVPKPPDRKWGGGQTRTEAPCLAAAPRTPVLSHHRRRPFAQALSPPPPPPTRNSPAHPPAHHKGYSGEPPHLGPLRPAALLVCGLARLTRPPRHRFWIRASRPASPPTGDDS
jgi:hypothetical protein